MTTRHYTLEDLQKRKEQTAHRIAAYEQRMADIARKAMEVKDLTQLQRLSDAVSLIERGQIRSALALEVYMERPYVRHAWNDLTEAQTAAANEFIKQEKMLPFRAHGTPARTPIKSEDAYAATRPVRRSESYDAETPTRQHNSSRGSTQRSRTNNERER